jgi:uncharacterized protein (UPF0248 family)
MKASIQSTKETISQIEELLDKLSNDPRMDRSSVHAIVYKMRMNLQELKIIEARVTGQNRKVAWGVL